MRSQEIGYGRGRISLIELARLLRGYGTLAYIKGRMDINDKKAIYLVYRLRKGGYVKTRYLPSNQRVYDIDPINAVGGESYLDVLNRHAPNKLMDFGEPRIHGKKLNVEETLIYAISQGKVRYIIACLALFRKIRDWNMLYRLAKEKGVVREVAALYEVARLVVSKVRRMPKRFRNIALPKKGDKYKYIVESCSSMHFQDIEKKYRVYIPLNWGDVQEYKGVFT